MDADELLLLLLLGYLLVFGLSFSLIFGALPATTTTMQMWAKKNGQSTHKLFKSEDIDRQADLGCQKRRTQ